MREAPLIRAGLHPVSCAGGVSLAGGRGGVFGPIVAVVILSLLRTDMTFLNVNTNLATVAQGVILVGVVMVGSLLQLRRSTT